jgi:hypothetical protein
MFSYRARHTLAIITLNENIVKTQIEHTSAN